MTNAAITVSCFLFVRRQTIHSFKFGNSSCNLFSENSSHDFNRDVANEKKAPSAAESAAELLLMPTWPGAQIKTVSFPYVVKSIYTSKIRTKIE